MKRRHAAYLTALIPIGVFALIVLVLDPELAKAVGNPALVSRIHLDMLLFGAVGVAGALISFIAVDGHSQPVQRG